MKDYNDEPQPGDPDFVGGLFNDDGTRIDPNLIPKPSLCLTCTRDDVGGEEEMLCLLNRNGQRDSDDFKCGAYEPKG